MSTAIESSDELEQLRPLAQNDRRSVSEFRQSREKFVPGFKMS